MTQHSSLLLHTMELHFCKAGIILFTRIIRIREGFSNLYRWILQFKNDKYFITNIFVWKNKKFNYPQHVQGFLIIILNSEIVVTQLEVVKLYFNYLNLSTSQSPALCRVDAFISENMFSNSWSKNGPQLDICHTILMF